LHYTQRFTDMKNRDLDMRNFQDKPTDAERDKTARPNFARFLYLVLCNVFCFKTSRRVDDVLKEDIERHKNQLRKSIRGIAERTHSH
jgi:hypothetical protein